MLLLNVSVCNLRYKYHHHEHAIDRSIDLEKRKGLHEERFGALVMQI